jgi:tetratricopeptide (TPR) repeat protein
MNQIKLVLIITSIIVFSIQIGIQETFGEPETEVNRLLNQASQHLMNGEYKESITIYDQILEINPDDVSTLHMKGISYNNMEEYTKAAEQFFKVLQENPDDVIALTGMGIALGNLGEYQESIIHLNKAHIKNPNNKIIENYKGIIENTIKKYPYTPTEKPISYKKQHNGDIPNWVKDTTNWWLMKEINEQDFLRSVEYMIEKNIIRIPAVEEVENKKNISEIRINLNLWSQNESSDQEFFKNVQWLVDNRFIEIKKTQEDIEHEEYLFKKYLKDILKNIGEEKRYIEFSNPSQDVIKKFLRDYKKWNFEQYVQMSSSSFPDPTYEIIDEVYIVKYKVYINQQPIGLPLDHISTLKNSFEFWEEQELKTNDQKLKMKFEVTKSKADANVWVTWVVRDIGEGVLGHAHLGKGVVEVTLGDYRCDGSFQLYDINSVKTIMTHELGHSIGLPHTNNQENIMYPSYTPSYAYCMLG